MKKRTSLGLLLFTLLGLFSPGFKKAPEVTKAEEITQPAKYLKLKGEETAQAWMSKDIGTVFNKGIRKFNHIVFFNSNEDVNITSIEHIKYEVRVTRPDGTVELLEANDKQMVSSNEVYHMRIKDNRQYIPLWVQREYKYYDYRQFQDEGAFVKTGEGTASIPSNYRMYYFEHYHYKFPQLGKTSNIKKLYDIAAQAKAGTKEYLIHEYHDKTKGFSDYTALKTYLGKQHNDINEYEYYLILPIESSIGLEVNYLSVKAFTADGTVITDDANVEPETDIETGEPIVEPETNKPYYNIPVIKTNGQMETASAFYFPGNSRYRLTGVKLNSYNDNDPDKDYDIKLYAGDLIGKTTLKDVADSVTKVTTLEYKDEFTELDYLFTGTANCILIDTPAEVVDFKATIRFVKEDDTNVIMPFALNLMDDNGTYGISGALQPDNDPNPPTLWGWISDTFGFTAGSGGIKEFFKDLGNVFKLALIAVLTIFLIIGLVKLIRAIRAAQASRYVREQRRKERRK